MAAAHKEEAVAAAPPWTPKCVNFRPVAEREIRRWDGAAPGSPSRGPAAAEHFAPIAAAPVHSEFLKIFILDVIDTYRRTSKDFQYRYEQAPRRVLTKLAKGVHNHGYTNAEYDYICRVGEAIRNPEREVYEIQERLGHGTFGQVIKCKHNKANGTSVSVAVKIIKSKSAYFEQGKVEVSVLQLLKKQDPGDDFHIVRMLDFFVYRNHLCIAFEILSITLYDVLKQNQFVGFALTHSMRIIKEFAWQLLRALVCLREAKVIHCDLKPENILLDDCGRNTAIKLVDFGSACFEGNTVYPYIQSRFYRSPEVLLGLPYTTAIDMWSLGCICAELFIGLPLFAGHSEYDQVFRICEVLGGPPAAGLEAGSNSRKFFYRSEHQEEIVDKPADAKGAATSGGSAQVQADAARKEGDPKEVPSARKEEGVALKEGVSPLDYVRNVLKQKEREEDGKKVDGPGASLSSGSTTAEAAGADDRPRPEEKPKPRRKRIRRIIRWSLKSREEYEKDEHKKEPPPRKYFHFESINHMIGKFPFNDKLSQELKQTENAYRQKFEQMLVGMLCLNPDIRWTPKQAQESTFMTGEPHDPKWEPPPDKKVTPFAKATLPARVTARLEAKKRGAEAAASGSAESKDKAEAAKESKNKAEAAADPKAAAESKDKAEAAKAEKEKAVGASAAAEPEAVPESYRPRMEIADNPAGPFGPDGPRKKHAWGEPEKPAADPIRSAADRGGLTSDSARSTPPAAVPARQSSPQASPQVGPTRPPTSPGGHLVPPGPNGTPGGRSSPWHLSSPGGSTMVGTNSAIGSSAPSGPPSGSESGDRQIYHHSRVPSSDTPRHSGRSDSDSREDQLRMPARTANLSSKGPMTSTLFRRHLGGGPGSAAGSHGQQTPTPPKGEQGQSRGSS